MRTIVVAFDGLRNEQRARLKTLAAGWRDIVYVPEKPASWDEILKGAEVVFGWPPPDALAHSSVLLHQLPSSGYDEYDIPALTRRADFRLTTARGVGARAVAEHGLAFLLAFNRGLAAHIGQRRERSWQRVPPYRLLRGQTLCIVGLGAIGEELARLAGALSMDVAAINRCVPANTSVGRIWSFSQQAEALRIADHVVLTMASTPGQKPIFSADQFAIMRPGSFFCNLARGGLVDEAALVSALRSGQIAGAGLDAFAAEPLADSSPFWSMPNVLITPHVAGRFVEETELLSELFLDNLSRYKNCQPLRNLVIGRDA